MKASIWAIILPRLEVSFLEEWIVHHLELGFDNIYLYDNGSSFEVNVSGDGAGDLSGHKEVVSPHYNVRPLEEKERGIIWEKKPYADYLLDLTDVEIYQKLHSIIKKYKKQVKLVNWRYGKETKFSYPFSQAIGYKHCVQNNKSDWWTTIDPDEYIMLHKHDNIKSFIKSNSQKPRLLLEQKIFDKRVVGKPVREIFNWGYEDGYTKTLVKKPYFFTYEADYEKNYSLNKTSVYFDVHETYSEIGTCTNNFNAKRLLALGYRYSENKDFVYNENGYKEIIWNVDRFVIDKNEAELFHYRGTSAEIGFSVMSKHEENQWSEFNKIDKSMEKYL